MKKGLLFWLWFACGLGIAGHAQTDSARPPATIKIVTLNLINPFITAFDLRGDIPVGPKWAVEAGAGYIFDSSPYAYREGEYYRGFKIRPAVKYYFEQSEKGNRFLSLVYRYHLAWNQQYAEVFRQGKQYVEWMTGTSRSTVQGLTLNFGWQHFKGSKKRLITEIYMGLGYRWFTVGQSDLVGKDIVPVEDLVTAPTSVIFWQSQPPGQYGAVDFCLGFNLGFRLNRK